MLRWVMQQLDIPAGDLCQATFRKRTGAAYSGHCWGRRFVCSIGPASEFPVTATHYYSKRKDTSYLGGDPQNQIEGLLEITAHELGHVEQFRHARTVNYRRGSFTERKTQFYGRKILELFRPQAEQLIAEWSAVPVSKNRTPALTKAERNELKARKALERWERKAKLAKTKVSQYRQKVRRYDRIAAARTSNS